MTARVEFEVPASFNPSRFLNTISNTGVSLEMKLLIGEPTLWSQYKHAIGLFVGSLFLAGLSYRIW